MIGMGESNTISIIISFYVVEEIIIEWEETDFLETQLNLGTKIIEPWWPLYSYLQN